MAGTLLQGAGQGHLDHAVDETNGVEAEPADPRQAARVGLAAGRLRLRLRARRRPRRMGGAVRAETAGRRHLDRLAGGQVEAAVVERAVDDAPVEPADRERGGHVRAAVVGGDDALREVGEEDVEVTPRDPRRARPGGRSATASTGSYGAPAVPGAARSGGVWRRGSSGGRGREPPVSATDARARRRPGPRRAGPGPGPSVVRSGSSRITSTPTNAIAAAHHAEPEDRRRSRTRSPRRSR